MTPPIAPRQSHLEMVGSLAPLLELCVSALSPENFLSATLRLPQIGRLNGNSGLDTEPLRIFDPDTGWDDNGSNYPISNLGRETPNNTGGTLLQSFPNAYDTYGLAIDLSDPDAIKLCLGLLDNKQSQV